MYTGELMSGNAAIRRYALRSHQPQSASRHLYATSVKSGTASARPAGERRLLGAQASRPVDTGLLRAGPESDKERASHSVTNPAEIHRGHISSTVQLVPLRAVFEVPCDI
jgi:hypothetical protein